MGTLCEGTHDHVHAHRRARSKRRAVTPRLDHSALMTRLRFGAAAKCGPRSRTAKDDVLLVHAYEVPCCRRVAGQPPSLGASRATRRTGQGRSDVAGTTADASRPAHRDRQPGALAATAV